MDGYSWGVFCSGSVHFLLQRRCSSSVPIGVCGLNDPTWRYPNISEHVGWRSYIARVSVGRARLFGQRGWRNHCWKNNDMILFHVFKPEKKMAVDQYSELGIHSDTDNTVIFGDTVYGLVNSMHKIQDTMQYIAISSSNANQYATSRAHYVYYAV